MRKGRRSYSLLAMSQILWSYYGQILQIVTSCHLTTSGSQDVTDKEISLSNILICEWRTTAAIYFVSQSSGVPYVIQPCNPDCSRQGFSFCSVRTSWPGADLGPFPGVDLGGVGKAGRLVDCNDEGEISEHKACIPDCQRTPVEFPVN